MMANYPLATAILSPSRRECHERVTNTLTSSSNLAISSGNSATLPDDSSTNELQQLELNNHQLSISNDNAVQLPLITDMLSAAVNATTDAGLYVKL
jgi:hypothetical protein